METFEREPLQGPGYTVQLEIEAACGCFGETDYHTEQTVTTTATTAEGTTFEPAAYEGTASLYSPSHGSDHDYVSVNSVQPL